MAAAWPTVLRDRFGVAAGDRVAIVMRNLPEWVDGLLGRRRGRRRRRAAQRLVDR